MLDFVAAIIFASTLGAGVMLSASLLFLYQGSIALLAQFIEPFLTDPVIAEMNCVGNVIIIGLAMNMLGISKFKVMNFVPAIFFADFIVSVYEKEINWAMIDERALFG